MKEDVFTFDPKKNQKIKVGVACDGVFTKVAKSNHKMNNFDAYGIQEDVFPKLAGLGVSEIRIETERITYVSKYSDWFKPGIKSLNFGHGKQRFLPVRMFKTETKGGQDDAAQETSI